jgi:hypothetical protein
MDLPAKEEPAEGAPDVTADIMTATEQPSAEPELEPWESLQVGDIVIHKSLGPGEVMALDDKYLILKFPDRESKFLYPDAFKKGYLSV